MADLDRTPQARQTQRHDGLASCRLCASADAAADHDWCPASEGLVCAACCRRVLLGDASPLETAMADADSPEAFEALITACLGCDRAQRWYAEQIHRRFVGGPGPC
jgi:hypothetical protein